MSIEFKNVSFQYGANSPFSFDALKDVSVSFEPGKITAVIGSTGSGKSTLVQHLNGLNKPTEGEVVIFDHKLIANEKPKGLKALRSKVGLVFQFPEMQLFEETVFKDVSFGPSNFGFTEEESLKSVKQALTLVGIDESLWERSPLDLSGGQKRRVAIAGVIASNPEVLVLDEPTAGLDPQGSKDMMALFLGLNQEHNKTIIMVTHDMDHVLNYADNVVVMDKGSCIYQGPAKDFFSDKELLNSLGFVLPRILQLKHLLEEKGYTLSESLDLDVLSQEIKRGPSHE
ncbi:MAG: energy-coupling factor transporter ATPase [Erysipelothrix sp.]|nr:energy-coupling factor transporter ATPase [Erysipelothrix sp.]